MSTLTFELFLPILKLLILAFILLFLFESFEKNLYIFFEQTLSDTFREKRKGALESLSTGLQAAVLSLFSRTQLAINQAYLSAGFIKREQAVLFFGGSFFLSGVLLLSFNYLHSEKLFLLSMVASMFLHLAPRKFNKISELKNLLMSFSMLVGFFSLMPEVIQRLGLQNLPPELTWLSLGGLFLVLASPVGTLVFVIKMFSVLSSIEPDKLPLFLVALQLLEVFVFSRAIGTGDYSLIFKKIYALQSGLFIAIVLAIWSFFPIGILPLYFLAKLMIFVVFILFSRMIWAFAFKGSQKDIHHHLSFSDAFHSLSSATLLHLSTGHVFKSAELVERFFELVIKHIREQGGSARSLAKIKDYERILDKMSSEQGEFIGSLLTKRLLSSDVADSLSLLKISDTLENLSDHLDKLASHWSALMSENKDGEADFGKMEASLVAYLEHGLDIFSDYRKGRFLKPVKEQENNQSLKTELLELQELAQSEGKFEKMGQLFFQLSQVRRDIKRLGRLDRAIGKA